MKHIQGSVCRTSSLALLAFAICVSILPLVPCNAIGAELSPLTLPSQNSEVRQYRRSQPSTGVVDDQFYKDFGTKVKTMPQAERDALLRSFREKRKSAQERQRVDEAVHYERLLTILEAKP